AIAGAAGHHRRRQVASAALADLLKTAVPQAAEEQRSLRETDAGVAHPDVLLDVAVGHEDVLPAVEVAVEEEGAEAGVELAGRADAAGRGDVHEEAILVAAVEGELLAAEVGDQDRLAAVVEQVAGVHPHAGLRPARLRDGYAQFRRHLL